MTDDFDVTLRRRLEGLAATVPVDQPGGVTAVVRQPVRARSTDWLALAGILPVLAVVVIGAVVASVLKIGPGPGDSSGRSAAAADGPIEATTRSGDFELTIRSAKARFAVGEPIEISASLAYLGSGSVQIAHGQGAGGTAVGFGVEEPVLGDLRLAPTVAESCERSTLEVGIPLQVPFAKAGGWSGDDPRADEYRAWFQDPVLRLSAGVWRVYAVAGFSIDTCSPDPIEMRVDLTIEVEERASVETPEPLPSEATGIDLLTAPEPSKGCRTQYNEGRLVRDLVTGLGIFADRFATGVVWPFGYAAREEDGVVVLFGADDREVAREGEVVGFSGPGPGIDGLIYACDDAREVPVAASSDDTIRLELRSTRSLYTGEPIRITASYTYIGPDPSIVVSHFAPEIGFSIEQLGVEGTRNWNRLYDSACTELRLERNTPRDVLLADHNLMMLRAVDVPDLSDPLPRDLTSLLPRGTWRITACLTHATGPCSDRGEDRGLSATIEIVVGPAADAEIELATGSVPTLEDGTRMCLIARGAGVLAVNPRTGLGFVDRSTGAVTDVIWPDGYRARYEDGRAILSDDSGETEAKEGESIELAGGYSGDNVFHVCGAGMSG